MIELSCFVACAFGKEDVDLIFDRAIEPVLSDLGMRVNRVDRIEHNDDIDDKIIELIHTCDVCVADLTYSRPSVYFEGGYFTGLNKPVVFTARKDHFTPKENDVHGIERIHFDLQMKNIIGWSSTEQVKTFSNRLKARLQYISNPIIARKTTEQKEAVSAKAFMSMSQKQRLSSLSDTIQTRLKRNSWKPIEYHTSAYFKPIGYPSLKKQKRIICIFVTNSAIKEYLRFVQHRRIVYQHSALLNSVQECHILIVSLRSVPQSRIDDMYPENQLLDEQTNTYYGGEEKKIKCYYHFISNVQS
jgi:nucleoside 2-deoxyribosyltransferase